MKPIRFNLGETQIQSDPQHNYFQNLNIIWFSINSHSFECIRSMSVTCWNCGEVSVFWISSALCGSDSPDGRYGCSLCCTSALARIGAMTSGVNTLAKSTTEEQCTAYKRMENLGKEHQLSVSHLPAPLRPLQARSWWPGCSGGHSAGWAVCWREVLQAWRESGLQGWWGSPWASWWR